MFSFMKEEDADQDEDQDVDQDVDLGQDQDVDLGQDQDVDQVCPCHYSPPLFTMLWLWTM